MGAIKDLVEKEGIDCDFVVTRAVDVQLNESVRDELKAGYDRLVSLGISSAKNTFYSPKETAEAACIILNPSAIDRLIVVQISGVKGAKGCFSYTAGHIWPYKLVLHLLKLAISQGVNLQTHTPVEKVSSTRDHRGYWTVTTPRGSISAKTIVYASNAYTSAILPEYKNAIVPVRGVCSRIVTPTGKSPHLPNSYIIRLNSSSEYDYLIPRSDGSIIVGGARSAYINDLKNWYDVTDDSKVLETTKKYFDGYMQRNFHGWEESGAYTDKVWTGSKSSPRIVESVTKTNSYGLLHRWHSAYWQRAQ